MKEQPQAHLQIEQIVWAAIDKEELAEEDRRHLLACPVCRRKVYQFKNELHDFGQKAELAVPPFTQQVKLRGWRSSAVKPHNGWLPFFGAAAMAAFIIFFYFMGLESKYPSQVNTVSSQETLLEDESLMREISEIVENPLPEDLYEITGENGSGFDDDFFDFVVPDTLDDLQSGSVNQGGIIRC